MSQTTARIIRQSEARNFMEGPEHCRVARIGETCEFKGTPFIAEAEYPNAYQSLGEMAQTLGPSAIACKT